MANTTTVEKLRNRVMRSSLLLEAATKDGNGQRVKAIEAKLTGLREELQAAEKQDTAETATTEGREVNIEGIFQDVPEGFPTVVTLPHADPPHTCVGYNAVLYCDGSVVLISCQTNKYPDCVLLLDREDAEVLNDKQMLALLRPILNGGRLTFTYQFIHPTTGKQVSLSLQALLPWRQGRKMQLREGFDPQDFRECAWEPFKALGRPNTAPVKLELGGGCAVE